MALKKVHRKEALQSRRGSILRAARNVFARKGYANTVVEDIAEQAGIAKGTLYLYFRSKEEVYMAALLEDARRLNTLTREWMLKADTWDAKLNAYIKVRLEYLGTNQDFFRIYLSEIRGMMMRNAPMKCEFFQVVRESEGQLAQVFAAAMAKNEIRSVDPEMAALVVSDLTHGLMERHLLGWSCGSGCTEADFALDLLCRSLAPQTEQSTDITGRGPADLAAIRESVVRVFMRKG